MTLNFTSKLLKKYIKVTSKNVGPDELFEEHPWAADGPTRVCLPRTWGWYLLPNVDQTLQFLF